MDVLNNYQMKNTKESSMSFEDVSAWVERVSRQGGWQEGYSKKFLSHEIDGQCLRELTLSLLKDIGVIKVGHRLTIMREIRQLLEGTPTEKLQHDSTNVLPVTSNMQGYTMLTTSHQLPVYMPQSSHQDNYDVNCFVKAPEAAPRVHINQTQYPVDAGVEQRFYSHEPSVHQPDYAQAGSAPQMSAPQIGYSQVKTQPSEMCSTFEESSNQVANNTESQKQQISNLEMKNEDDSFPAAEAPIMKDGDAIPTSNVLEMKDDDSFPNAESLEMPMEPPSVQGTLPHHTEPQQLSSEGNGSSAAGTPTDQKQAVEEVSPVAEPVVQQKQVRPSAWGSSNKLRIGPKSTNTASKLLIQTTPRLSRNSRRQKQQKKMAKNEQSEMDEPRVYAPLPQPGDILKGTVKQVVPNIGAFIDINSLDDALLPNKEGIKNLRPEQNKSYWLMVKKVDETRIHLTSFVPGVCVQGTISHQYPTNGNRTGFFVNVGWYKPGLLLLKRMKERGRKKNQKLNLFVLKHKLKVIRNQQPIAELDLTEVRPQDWKPEDVYIWAQSFYGPDELVPEAFGQLSGKDIFSLTPQTLEQLGVTDSNKQERLLLCAKLMAEQRTKITQRTRKQQANKAWSQAKIPTKTKVPLPPAGDSHYPALGNQRGKR